MYHVGEKHSVQLLQKLQEGKEMKRKKGMETKGIL